MNIKLIGIYFVLFLIIQGNITAFQSPSPESSFTNPQGTFRTN